IPASPTPPAPIVVTNKDYRVILDLCRNAVQKFFPLTGMLNKLRSIKEMKKRADPSYNPKRDWWSNLSAGLAATDLPSDLDWITEKFVKPELYEEKLKDIRRELSGHKCWMSLATTVELFREEDFVEVLIGILGKECDKTKVYVINRS